MLSFIDSCNDDDVALYAKGDIPEPLTSFFDDKYKEVWFSEIAKIREHVYTVMSLSAEQAHLVEEKTRE